ncbi:Copia protein [Symbiodinium microadriaticum]|uniref:Copia protein n=1 Tax=Symbiodinium microadriaticum TaxID=2951 RepID=A0A1Q9F1U5_SYMMI|nr:Copia protein [Symbiodinium microadriaticum]
MFRTSLLRSNLKVDTNPSYESVEGYYRHLMGEMEALAVGSTPSSTTTTTSTPKQEPRLRPFKGEPKGGPTGTGPPKAGGSSPGSTASGAEQKYDKPKSEVPCKFFGRVARGCARGSKCPFMHSWEGLDKKDKCLLCGGRGHMQKECPSRKGTPPGSLGGTPKSGSEKPVQASSSSSTTTTKAVRIDEVPEVNEIRERGNAEPSISSNDLRDVLADVGRVLKSMTATTLKKMEVKVKEVVAATDHLLGGEASRLEGSQEGPTGLLDTGASHAMRTATRAEYTDATPVKVTLAGEDEKILRQNDRGTILVQEEEGKVQPIVPLGALIEGLGYTLHWSPTKLKLTHPEKGSVRVRVNNHCPEVAACDALAMIRELEMKQVNALNSNVESLKARLEVVKMEEKREWYDILKSYATTGNKGELLKVLMRCPFTKALPTEVHSMMLEGFDVNKGEAYLKALPLTRRARKAMLASRKWVVSLYLDENHNNHDPLRLIPKEGKVLLEVNVANSRLWDLHKCNAAYQLLLWAAATGRISDVVGSPPRATWTTASGGNRNVNYYKNRTPTDPYGNRCLPPLQQQRVHRETAYAVKQMLIWMLASVGARGPVGFIMEMDPEKDCLNTEDASFWDLELWKAFKSIGGMRKVSFDMGTVGHRTRRPTTVATNYPLLYGLEGERGLQREGIPASLLTQGEINAWSTGFREMVRQAVGEGLDGSYVEEEELIDNGLKEEDARDVFLSRRLGWTFQTERDPYMDAVALPDLEKELYVPDDSADEETDPLEIDPEDYKDEAPSDGEEGEEDPCGPETLDEKVEKLTKGEEPATIYITRPLRRRTTSHVLQASKELLLQLRQSGLHVDVLHTDRAREFKAKAYKEWVVESKLRHTKTAGGDPAGNSTAELGVKWAKSRMRALLKGSNLEARDWPMAMSHASASLWAKVFPTSPWTARPATTFGNEVWFRSKIYQGKAEKKHDAVGSRWKRGWYAGPAMDVKRGHILVRDDGGLTVAKSVKFNVVNPEQDCKDLLPPAIAEGLPEELLQDERPPTKSELREEIEFRARKLLEEKDFSVAKVVELYDLLEALGDVDRRVSTKTSASSWYTGAFVHGGVAGLRNNMRDFPWTTRYLTGVARSLCGDIGFSALGMARNQQLGLHRDVHNSRNSMNYVIPLQLEEGGSIWVQKEDVEDDVKVLRTLPSGRELQGHLVDLRKGQPISFSPRRWHEVQPWKGERLVLLLYTPRSTKLIENDIKELNEMGFNLQPDVSQGDGGEGDNEEQEEENYESEYLDNVKVKMLQIDRVQDAVFVEMEEADFFDPKQVEEEKADDPLGEGQPQVRRTVLKKAEVQYTADVEAILEELDKTGSALEVTHNVSLGEVRKHLSRWKQSAFKEYHNLAEVKKAFTVRSRAELPPNCRIVPCKGVYTVKPDKGGYRRKTRFVACGNHVPEDGATDLFATGVDATSLRTMLAFNARRPWKVGTTDVRQAFVLAKWLGQPVALELPAIAYELGLAERGQVWFVEQAIYGLRESPALWSQFRDSELRLARWTGYADGKEVTMKLEQLVTDDQIWRIVREDAKDTQTYGYVLVYIDDLLIQTGEENLRAFYQWVADKWEVDALDVLDYDHSIRFLGMELHQTSAGIELGQEGFVRELLRSYKHNGARSTSQGPKELLILSHEEEEALLNAEACDLQGMEAEVKQAQKRVGELMWLMSRTRPDIQYIVALMSSRITRSPELVNRIGQRLLDYLNETIGYRVRLGQEECDPEELNVYTDSSFAPSGGRSHGASAVFLGRSPLTWRSSRQPLVTLSTAESELIEGIEGTLLAMSTRGVLQELTGRDLRINLYVDNQAAVTLLTASSGSWRTRYEEVFKNAYGETEGEVRTDYALLRFANANRYTRDAYGKFVLVIVL